MNRWYWLYLLLCILTCCAVLELLTRTMIRHKYGFKGGSIADLYQYDERLGLRTHKPNLEVRGTKTYIKINSLGFRGNDFSKEKDQNTIRIAVLGASTTFCAEVSSNDKAWPEVLQQKLNAHFTTFNFEVINGGVGGYGIDASLKNLRERILKLKPDIVIVYHATNDIAFQSRRLAITLGLIEEGETAQSSFPLSFLIKHSQALNLLYKNIAIVVRQKRTTTSSKLTEFGPENADRFITYLDSIRLECGRINNPLMIFTFSTKFRHHQPYEQQIRNMNTAMYYMPWMAPGTILQAFDSFNQQIYEFAQAHDDVFVDTLHNLIPGDEIHFVDSVHFSDQGCSVMAERIYQALLLERLVEYVNHRSSHAERSRGVF